MAHTQELRFLNGVLQEIHTELSKLGVEDKETTLLERLEPVFEIVRRSPRWVLREGEVIPRCPICDNKQTKDHKKWCAWKKVLWGTTITDDYQIWDGFHSECGSPMQVVRPGKVQCVRCG